MHDRCYSQFETLTRAGTDIGAVAIATSISSHTTSSLSSALAPCGQDQLSWSLAVSCAARFSHSAHPLPACRLPWMPFHYVCFGGQPETAVMTGMGAERTHCAKALDPGSPPTSELRSPRPMRALGADAALPSSSRPWVRSGSAGHDDRSQLSVVARPRFEPATVASRGGSVLAS